MRSLGIDPGISNTGIALVASKASGYTLESHVTIRTSKKDTEAKRYRHIQCEIEAVIEAHLLDCVAIERVFFGQNITSNQTTAGVIALALCETEKRGITPYLLTPQEIKTASGLSGKARKASLAKVAQGIFGVEFTARQNHVCDAAFAAIAGALKHRTITPNAVSTEYVSVPASAIVNRNTILDERIDRETRGQQRA